MNNSTSNVSSNELEEEFFRVEGRPVGSAACEYVFALQKLPNGCQVTAKHRAALWFLAYSVRDGVARVQVASVAAHVDVSVWEARALLFHMVSAGVLELTDETRSLEEDDVHSYVFPELRKATQG